MVEAGRDVVSLGLICHSSQHHKVRRRKTPHNGASLRFCGECGILVGRWVCSCFCCHESAFYKTIVILINNLMFTYKNEENKPEGDGTENPA